MDSLIKIGENQCMKKVLGIILSGILLIASSVAIIPTQAADPLAVLAKDQPQAGKNDAVLSALSKAGLDKTHTKIQTDYGIGKGKSPYSRIWNVNGSNKQVLESSPLPMVDADGVAISPKWNSAGASEHFTSGNNIFLATVNNLTTTITIRNDQPTGVKKNATLTTTPELYVGGLIRAPISVRGTLFVVDPLNENYTNNNIVWYYASGIERHLRVIEGQIQGYWIFNGNPYIGWSCWLNCYTKCVNSPMGRINF